jgi:hypothetical protein
MTESFEYTATVTYQGKEAEITFYFETEPYQRGNFYEPAEGGVAEIESASLDGVALELNYDGKTFLGLDKEVCDRLCEAAYAAWAEHAEARDCEDRFEDRHYALSHIL